MEVQLGPNPIDEPNLLYKLQRKLKVFNTNSNLPNRGYGLVASASKYGIVFVASPEGKLAVYYLSQLIDKESEAQHLPIQLQENPTHIAVSCNDELLAVTGGQLLAIYKITNFQNQNITPSLSVKCDVNPSTFVSDLKWNPCIPDIIAVTFFDGTIIMLQASNGQVKKVQSKARCLCWSPKGKQMVVGNSDGTLCQYKPDLTPAKTIPAPNIFEGAPVEVLAIHWISTFQFAVVYRNASDHSRPAVTIVNTPKGGQAMCQTYEDICYSMGNDRPWFYYLQGLASWNMILCASSNSMEMATLGSPDSATWSQWCQVDEARPELPMTKNQENYPVGLTFNLSAIHELPWGENEKLPPMPTLLVVSQTGLLSVFNVINVAKQAPPLCQPPQPLTLPAAVMISASVEPAPGQASPALTAALQSKPAQAAPTAQPTQPLLPTPQASSFAPPPPAQSFAPKTQETAPFAPKPQSQPFGAPAQALPFTPSAQAAKPAAAQLFGAANATSKPFSVPQPATQSFTAAQTQAVTKPAEAKPAPVAQPPLTQPQPKPDIMQPTDTQVQNAALKAEQENANKLKANQEFRNMLIREVNEFQMDLYKFVTKTRAVQNQFYKELQSIDTKPEIQKLDVQAIKKDCSLEELRNTIIAQKLDLVRTCAIVADARTQADAKELDQWTQADPLTTKRVASVKKLSYYVQNQLEQAHRLLEYKWNQQTDRDLKMKKPGHAMIRPILDDVYQPLVKQQEILSRQQALLKTLRHTLKECDFTPKFKSTSILRTTPFKKKDPLLNLTKNVLNMSLEVKPVEEKNTLTPQKLDALRDLLSNHKTVKIKPVNVEMRHHLAVMRINYEKSEKEQANAQIALVKKTPVKVEPKPVKVEPKPVKMEPAPFVIPPSKPFVKTERVNPQDQTKVTPIESFGQSTISQTHSGQFIEAGSKLTTKKLDNVQQKFEQSSIEAIDASYAEKRDSNSSGFITDLTSYQKSNKSANQPLKAIENTSVSNMGAFTQNPAFNTNNSGPFASNIALNPRNELQPSLLNTSIDSMGGTDQSSNANVSSYIGEVVQKKSTKTEKPVEQKAQVRATGSKAGDTAPPNVTISRLVKTDPSQSSTFTPINMKAGAAPSAVRTLFSDKEKQETTKTQPQTSEALNSNKTLKELLQSKQVTVSPTTKKDDSANTFMGQKICSPTSIDFSSVIVATPTSYTTKPISELSNMFKQFAPQAFSASSDETGEQELPKPDTKPMSNIFSMKASAPLPSSKNASDVLATSKMVTIKRVEPKSEKGDDKSKENVPDKASENVILNVPKVGKEEKKEPKPLSAQNKTSDPTCQPDITSASGETEKADSENSKVEQKYEAASKSSSSIFASANASVTVSKPQSMFGASALSSSNPVVTESTTTKASTSITSSIFATAAAAEATKTEFPSIFQTPPASSPTTESGSIFGTATSTSTSIFASASTTTPSSIFGASNTTPSTTSSTAASVFGSTAKSVFGSAFATTTTDSSSATSASPPTFGTTPTSTTSVFGAATPPVQSGPTSPSSIFASATSPTPEDQSKPSIFGTATPTAKDSTAATTASIFSTPATTTSIFGSPSSTTQPSVFGGTQTSVFGSTATTQASIFGGTATTQASVFGTPKTTQASAFGSPQTTQSSVFGSPTTGSVFGTSGQTSQGSIFGGTTQSSVFGSQAPSVFGSPQTTQASVFGSATPSTQASIFGTQTTQASVFGAATQPSVFGSPQTTQASVFGSPQTTQASVFGSPQTTQASVFGSPQTTQASVFGSPQNTQASVFGSSNQSVFSAATTASSMFGSDDSLFNSVNITTTSAGGSKNIFGGSSSGTSVFGGGGGGNVFGGKASFSQPDPAAAAIFGGASSFGQSAQPANNLWGSNNNSGGGFGSPGFGQQATTQASSVFGSGSFSATSPGTAFGSPTQQTGGFGSGFGASATFAQPARFGSPTSGGFGAPASFGGISRSPGGGFGAAASFGGSAFGAAAQTPVFGGGSTSPGFGSPTQSNATFESLATQNTLTFGNLAQQSPQQSQPAPSFNTSPSFTGWRG